MANKPGRPRKPPGKSISVPIDKIAVIERILGHPVAANQTPTVKVRVPAGLVDAVRAALRSEGHS